MMPPAVGCHEAQHNGAHDVQLAVAGEDGPGENAHGDAEEVGPEGHLQGASPGEKLIHGLLVVEAVAARTSARSTR